MAEPLSTMTILDLTQLWNKQDDRWSRILTYAQSIHNPAAPAGMAFFKNTWRRALSDYYENVATRYDASAKAPVSVIKRVLDQLADVIYPAARRVGLPDESFLFPDITTERGRPATAVGGYSWMYW